MSDADQKTTDAQLQQLALKFHRAFNQVRGLFVAIEKHGEAVFANDDADIDEADRCLALGAAGKEFLEQLVEHHVEMEERYEQIIFEQRVERRTPVTS